LVVCRADVRLLGDIVNGESTNNESNNAQPMQLIP